MVRPAERGEADLETIVGRTDGFGGSLRTAAQWLLADVYYRLGAFDDAIVTADLAGALLQDTGRARSPEMAMACAVGAYAASAKGDWADADAYVAAAQARTGPTSSKFERASAGAAEWSLARALDHPAQMLRAACAFDLSADAPELSCSRSARSWPRLCGARPLDEADARLAAYADQAARLGRDSALVAVGRVRGLLEADRNHADAALSAFGEAAPMADRLAWPLEAARFKAAHGLVLGRFASAPPPSARPRRPGACSRRSGPALPQTG